MVGNKSDLESERKITTKQGQYLAEEFEIAFYECSSKTAEGVDEIFAFMSLSLYQKAKLKQKTEN